MKPINRHSATSVRTPEDATDLALCQIVSHGNWVGEKKEFLNYFMEIREPTTVNEDKKEVIMEMLDDWHGDNHYHVTTNWTFPTDDIKTGLTGEPIPSGETGEYFDRLCKTEKGNQLESMVEKIDKWGRNNRTVAQVFQVDQDLNAMFPPCLLTLQALARDGKVNLTAHFRSHTLAKSYYGDLTALCRLQEWLSNKVDREVGTLTVLSGSIHIRKKNDEHELAEQMVEALED